MLEPGGDQPPRPGQVKPGMTIAAEIAAATFGRMMEDGGSCYVIGMATFDKKGIEFIISAKLDPIRELVESVQSGSSMLTFKAEASLKEILAMLDAS